MRIAIPPRTAAGPSRRALADRYRAVRAQTERLCEPLAVEDYGLQSMPDASPPKWHLAHTTWFFETFVLAGRPSHSAYHPAYNYLYNSYYEAVGARHPRPQRGLLSRPTVKEVTFYRRHVDAAVLAWLTDVSDEAFVESAGVFALGLEHEQQHQELLLTDLKHAFGLNPLRPAYRADLPADRGSVEPPLGWVAFPEGLRWLGHDGMGFAFDNESPRHRVFVQGFALADRLVTNGEYLRFVEAGGYDRPEWWLSDGWAVRRAADWHAPLYWEAGPAGWRLFTLGGVRDLDPAEPVGHVSYYEADAYARWAGARLPTEAEWETAAETAEIDGNFVERDRLHPAPRTAGASVTGIGQLFGDAWEWTASPYAPYPGYRPAAGALGEYNGKFMCNQMVLRGGSCVSPHSHLRRSYRNFFPPEARWQFSTIRLARPE